MLSPKRPHVKFDVSPRCSRSLKASVIYISKTRAAGQDCKMRVGLHHDAAAYCGEDTLVPVAFLPVSGIACLLPFIAMPRVLPLEDCDVTDIVEELRRARLSDFLATVEASGYLDVQNNSWFARGLRSQCFDRWASKLLNYVSAPDPLVIFRTNFRTICLKQLSK